MKLKTLKDIDIMDICIDQDNYFQMSSSTENRIVNKLRQEAINWIKELDKDMEKIRKSLEDYRDFKLYEQREGTIPNTIIIAQHQISWIKHFFNIKEGELK